jgi:hypothetical protein
MDDDYFSEWQLAVEQNQRYESHANDFGGPLVFAIIIVLLIAAYERWH